VDEGNAKMAYGKDIGEKLATDPTFLPEVKRYKVFEQRLTATISGVPLVGYLDSFCPDTFCFQEYKTSSNIKKWNKKSADKHGQLDFYYLLIYLNHRKKPEDLDCHLWYIPVEEVVDFTTDPFTVNMEINKNIPIQSFHVKKTMSDILSFAKFIIKTYKEMEEYALAINEERFIIIDES
jgi:hypothetical protein